MYNIKIKNLSSFVECQQWSTNKVVSTPTKFDLNRGNYTSAIYHMWAKIGKYFLKDIDILPLQGLSWQTNVVVFDKFFHVFTTGKCSYLEILSLLPYFLFLSKFCSLQQLTWTTWHENTQLMVTKLSSCPLKS